MTKFKEKELHKALDLIIKEYSPERVILYGSHASGRSRPSSDIDLMVLKKTKKRLPERIGDIHDILYRKEHWRTMASLLISVTVWTPQEYKTALKGGDFFIQEVQNKGTVLYEKK